MCEHPRDPDDRTARPPIPLASLVGRTQELRWIAGTLERDDVRLVVLTGPGGVGKTRLAVAAAAEVASRFRNGAIFINLAPAREPRDLISAIADALGVRETGVRPLVEVVAAALRDREVLLVLDNFEQIVSAAPSLVDLLVACPRVKLLVTSRAILRVSGEHVFPLRPLSLPTTGDSGGDSEAVHLFVERATAVHPDLLLDDTALATIGAICRRLDGLPLAIELAAARLRHLPLGALLAGLDDRMSLLTGGSRDQPRRLRTMRDAIAWSYELLEPEEQSLFRSLSVFSGGFSLTSAGAVSRVDGDGALFDAVTSLIDNSLVYRSSDEGDIARYGMLEVIREYGHELLDQAGEAEAVHQCLAEWVVEQAEQAWPAFVKRTDQDRWLSWFDAEMNNARAALTWLESEGRTAQMLQVTGALSWYWYVRGQFSEGRFWLSRALALTADSPAPFDTNHHARAAFGAGLLGHFQGDDEQATEMTIWALSLWSATGDAWGLGVASLVLGIIAEDEQRYDVAEEAIRRAIVHTRRAGDRANEALALYHLGIVRWGAGDLYEAERLCREALEIQQEIVDRWGEANTRSYLGIFASLRGQLDEAARAHHESVRLRLELDTPLETEQIAQYLANVATVATFAGDAPLALRLFAAEDSIRSLVGSRRQYPERLVYETASARARRMLPDPDAERAWEAGATSPIATTVELAREFRPGPAERQDATGASIAGRYEHVTQRELEVLRLLAEGLTNAEIAERLYISPGTVRIHVSRILAKLGARTRTEAARLAREQNLVPDR
jgi:predicted ATPase/DNA-binding CsgD family transcriptional regulator